MDDTGSTTAPEGASGQPPAEVGAGAILSNGDSGALVRLSPGEEVVLRLTPPLQDSTPAVADPEVVEIVPVQHFADPGYAEYELVARAPGETRIAARGAGADGPGVQVVVVVQGG